MKKDIKLIFTIKHDENVVNKIKELIILFENKGLNAIDFYTKYTKETQDVKENYIDEFLNEYNISSGKFKIRFSYLYQLYNEFCDLNCFNKNITKTNFKSFLQNNGISIKRVNTGYIIFINKEIEIL
jgi:hypothetical protein